MNSYIPADAFDEEVVDDPKEQEKVEETLERELEQSIEEEASLQSGEPLEN